MIWAIQVGESSESKFSQWPALFTNNDSRVAPFRIFLDSRLRGLSNCSWLGSRSATAIHGVQIGLLIHKAKLRLVVWAQKRVIRLFGSSRPKRSSASLRESGQRQSMSWQRLMLTSAWSRHTGVNRPNLFLRQFRRASLETARIDVWTPLNRKFVLLQGKV